jgi:hypothetical protein
VKDGEKGVGGGGGGSGASDHGDDSNHGDEKRERKNRKKKIENQTQKIKTSPATHNKLPHNNIDLNSATRGNILMKMKAPRDASNKRTEKAQFFQVRKTL